MQVAPKQILTGRVFTRLQQFHALPQELKDEVAGLERHLMTIQNEVFAKHHTLQLKSIHGVRYKPLLETVHEWVQTQEALPVTAAPTPVLADNTPPDVSVTDTSSTPSSDSTSPTGPTPAPHALPADTSGTPAAAVAVPLAPTVAVDDLSTSSDEAAEAKRTADEATETARLTHAKKLVDALVLKGFITPNKEDKSAVPTLNEEFSFKDSELLVPLAAVVTGLTIPRTTAWDLVDGAVFAATLKRRAGLLAPLTHGKDTYVIVNARARSITLFESDIAREAIRIFEAALTHVTHDKAHYENGVKLWDETDDELFNPVSIAERDAFVAALEAVGVTFQEEFPIPDHHAKPANFNTSHTFTVEEVTTAASDAVPLDDNDTDTTEKFKTHVPLRSDPKEAEIGETNDDATETTFTPTPMPTTTSTATTTPTPTTTTTPTTTPTPTATITDGEMLPKGSAEKTKKLVSFEMDAKDKHMTDAASDKMTPAVAPYVSEPAETNEPLTTNEPPRAITGKPHPESMAAKTNEPLSTATTTNASKYDETSSTSPARSTTPTTNATNLFGEGFTDEKVTEDDQSNGSVPVNDQKADKVFHFDEPLPATKTEASPPKSSFFGFWTSGGNANATNTTPAP